MMIRTIKSLFAAFTDIFSVPPLDVYGIPERPRRNTDPKPNARTTEHKVHNGKIHRDTVADDGTIETTIGNSGPQTVNDVTIDAFDISALDALIGTKWTKSRERAAVMKWHWLNGHSARQIEQLHTDTKTKEIERGFSERTAADYVAAFYESDNARDRAGRPRLRDAAKQNPPMNTDTNGAKTVEW